MKFIARRREGESWFGSVISWNYYPQTRSNPHHLFSFGLCIFSYTWHFYLSLPTWPKDNYGKRLDIIFCKRDYEKKD